jgi:cytochrome c oxidase subunit III
MGILTPTLTGDPRTLHGGGAGVPPRADGGDGGGGENGGPDYGARLRRARLGMAVGLTAVVMLFVSLTSALIFRRGLPTLDDKTNQYVRDWLPVALPTLLLLINTGVLLVSSVTMELARRQIARQVALAGVERIPGVSLGRERRFPWLGATVALGLTFLFGQWLAWQELANRGYYVSTFPSSSFAYLLTGTHAVHLAGGILALLYAATTTLLGRPVEARRIAIDITAWYWHFMALLWIYIFALLEFAR